MNNLANRRLKIEEVKSASIPELIEAQHKVFISRSDNWEMLCDNRNTLDNELARRVLEENEET